MFERDELMARNGVIEAISPIEVLVNGEGDLAALANSVSPGSVAYTPGKAQRWQLSPAREWVECTASVNLEALSVDANGTYAPPKGVGYGPVTVAVPLTEVTPLRAVKNGVYDAGAQGAYNPVTVEVAAGEPDVAFYDYDGTLVAGYSAEEFADATALPANPVHEGLVAQGWNWSLEDAKDYVEKYGMLIVGQTYDTIDGKTRIYIHVDEALPASRQDFTLGFYNTVEDGVEIDWGDGSEPMLSGAVDNGWKQHNYTVPGDYVITLTVLDGEINFNFTSISAGVSLFGSFSDEKYWYNMSRIRRIEVGSSAGASVVGKAAFGQLRRLESISLPNTITSIGASAFQYASALKYVTVPAGVTTIGTDAFRENPSLRTVALPSTLTTLGENVFYDIYGLKMITLPEGLTEIPACTFYEDYSLERVVLPEGIDTIGQYAFYKCQSMLEIKLPSTIRTLNQNIFQHCHCLRSLAIPEGVTVLPKNVIMCHALTEFSLPSTLTTFDTSSVNGDSIVSLTIPASVTTINNQAFSNLDGSIAEFHFLTQTPPTFGTSVFPTRPSDYVIYVPKGCLDAYRGMTNMSTYAAKIQEEPD